MQEERERRRGQVRARRLVHRRSSSTSSGRFDGRDVVPTRFVRACPRGHIDDVDWRRFVHGADDPCRRQLWLDERGTGGDLADLIVRCECGKSRGTARGGRVRDPVARARAAGCARGSGDGNREDCTLPSRLLIRTAANAYFPQVMSALSLPDAGRGLQQLVAELWDDLRHRRRRRRCWRS